MDQDGNAVEPEPFWEYRENGRGITMPRLDVNAVRRIGCAALLLGLFSQLAIFLVPSNANEREPTPKCDVESEIEEFCKKNEITEHAVHVALAHLWCRAAASRGADALEPSERPHPDNAQQLRVGYADLYWVGWCARLEAVDLELSASGSIRSVLVLELKDPGSPGFSRESSTDAYLAGDKSAWSLVLKALEEAQDARGEPENVGMGPRAFSRELPHYQAILLLKHMIRNDSRLGRWRKPQGMLESNSEQARELKRPPVKRELVLTKKCRSYGHRDNRRVAAEEAPSI